jgi:beta-lactamase regulating signal transducer with metallopeptidase domain
LVGKVEQVKRWPMTPLVWLLVVWGALTAVLVILLIYRSTLTMHEDEQLFLSESESQMEREQIEIMHKVDKLNPFVRWLGAASGLLILVIAGLAIYQGLNQVQ